METKNSNYKILAIILTLVIALSFILGIAYAIVKDKKAEEPEMKIEAFIEPKLDSLCSIGLGATALDRARKVDYLNSLIDD